MSLQSLSMDFDQQQLFALVPFPCDMLGPPMIRLAPGFILQNLHHHRIMDCLRSAMCDNKAAFNTNQRHPSQNIGII